MSYPSYRNLKEFAKTGLVPSTYGGTEAGKQVGCSVTRQVSGSTSQSSFPCSTKQPPLIPTDALFINGSTVLTLNFFWYTS